MAYKVFTNGSVLNASEIQQNLMDQSVMVFSNSTARAAALTAPVEGMVTYLEDTSAYQSYDGAAWIGFGGGSAILQVVSATTSTQVDSTSLSYITTGLTATITPSSTSSKIAIFVATNARNANITSETAFTIFRGTVAGTDLSSGLIYGFGSIYNSSGQQQAVVSLHIIDSPNTTSAQTYTLGMKNTVSGGSARAQNGALGSIILMEVAG